MDKMKLIVEVTEDGTYVYLEEQEHFDKVESQRLYDGSQVVTYHDLQEDCLVNPGHHVVVDLEDLPKILGDYED